MPGLDFHRRGNRAGAQPHSLGRSWRGQRLLSLSGSSSLQTSLPPNPKPQPLPNAPRPKGSHGTTLQQAQEEAGAFVLWGRTFGLCGIQLQGCVAEAILGLRGFLCCRTARVGHQEFGHLLKARVVWAPRLWAPSNMAAVVWAPRVRA